MQPTPAPGRIFYGWYIVAGTFTLLFLGFGAAYSFAAFFGALRDEFDASRGDVSLVFSITGFLYFTLGAVSGTVADRVGPRRVTLAGVALMTAGLLLASQAQALWQVYLTYSVGVGVGVGLVYVPAVGAVQRWFTVRRGFASGLAVTGIGVGTLVMPPLAAVLIDVTSWRWTYFALAVLILVAGIIGALVLEHSPARRGLDAEGTAPASSGAPVEGLDTRAAVRSRTFAFLYASGLTTSLGLFIPFVHLAPYAKDHDMSSSAGASLVGLIGLGSSSDGSGSAGSPIGSAGADRSRVPMPGWASPCSGGWPPRTSGRSPSSLSPSASPTVVSWRSCPPSPPTISAAATRAASSASSTRAPALAPSSVRRLLV